MTYAIIKVGGKQHRVREGEWLLVDRLPVEEGKTFQPDVLLIGGDGEALLGDELSGKQVTARVTEHVLGPKIVIGKHRRRTGYRRRNGFRARLSKIEIESIGAKRASRSRKTTAAAAPASEGAAEEKPKRTRRTTKKTDGE
jgi:large subunit ribosomal protein L21